METKNCFNSKYFWVMVCILVLEGVSAFAAQSVFAVAGHANGKIKAYSIDPNSAITYQATIPNPVEDATGLCLWPSKDRMFVTYEGSGKISWASIKNLSRDPINDDCETGITGGNGLGGMAVDEGASRLYVIARGTNHLYAFNYDESENTLIPIPLSETTMYRTLPEVVTTSYGAFDIAIDPQGSTVMGFPVGRLYVSDNTGNVHYYNVATWEHEGTIPFEQSVIGIGLDAANGYLYGGNFSGGGGNSFLMRMPLDGDPNDYVEKNMGYSVMDISVDEATGYLYLTSYRYYNGRYGAVEVYDPTNWTDGDPDSLVQIDIENDADFGGSNNGPAGIAVGPSYKPSRMSIFKDDDVNDDPNYPTCVVPDDFITYTIAFHAGAEDEPNVVVTDKLPVGVDFISADPNTGVYDSESHTCTWVLGYVDGWDPNVPGDPNYYFELTVQVNNYAEPIGKLHNIIMAESDISYSENYKDTPVCCWGGDIIFVDRNAPGPHTGTSWETAYLDLQDALERVNNGCGNEIWVADGTYHPTNGSSQYPQNDTFEIPAGVSVYGGFNGGETSLNDRNILKYKAILNGFVREDPYWGSIYNNTVVTMGDGSLLDGFTVEEGNWRGIYADGVSFSISNCTIVDNQQRGIYCINGNLTVQWCEIYNNGYQGIHHYGNGKLLTVENSKIHDNQQDGILTEYSTSTVINSLIYQNGLGSTTYYHYYGIHLGNPSSSPTIRNNTIVQNNNEGIRFVGSYAPDIVNCIVYYNGGNSQLAGIDPDDAAYNSCIADCNEVNSNFNDVPGFAYLSDPNGIPIVGNYHLAYNSPCVDTGDDDSYTNETDIDGEPRVYGTLVDRGADEAYSCDDDLTEDDIYNAIDWDADGIINYHEFAPFAAAWLSHDPNEPGGDPNLAVNWNSTCNFDDTDDSEYVIDLADFEVFCNNWLWTACWKQNQFEIYGMMAMSGGGESMLFMEATAPTEMAIAEEPPVVEEKSMAEQILDLQDAIEFLEQIWMEDDQIQQEIDPQAWQEFMDSVYQSLTDLQAETP